MGFQSVSDPAEKSNSLRHVMPPDRVWLALMYWEGKGSFGWIPSDPGKITTFDANGSYELRYERYRRYSDNHDALPYDSFCPP